MSSPGLFLAADAPAPALHPGLKLNEAKRRFARRGRVQLHDFLEPAYAAFLANHLAGLRRWNLKFVNHGRHLDIDKSGFEKLPKEKQSESLEAINGLAAEDFQYLYAGIPVAELYAERRGTDPVLDALFEFLNSGDMLRVARAVTGAADIVFIDAQATRYEPGHFLTRHDDAVEGKGRRAAYVLNLTRRWRADWGGHLLFYEGEDIAEGYAPAFNVLNIFRVPSDHAVGRVAPFAREARLSVTGWMRTHGD